MKNKIKYLILLALTIGIFNSCDEDTTGGVTGVTYYPVLELEGDVEIFIDKGATFIEPGYSSVLNGVDVTGDVEVITDLDETTAGVYTISYSSTNVDGFSRSASRTIYVADPTPSIISNGIHTAQVGTQRFWNSTSAVVPFDGYDIVILQTEPGVFYISDFMGGYYDQKSGYGSSYAMTGNFKLNADNTITAIDSKVPGWGDAMDYLNDGTVDPVTGQITYKLGYAGLMEYTIILN